MSIISALSNRRSHKEGNLPEKKVSDMSANGSLSAGASSHYANNNNNNNNNTSAQNVSLHRAPNIKGATPAPTGNNSINGIGSNNSLDRRTSASSAPTTSSSYKNSFNTNMQDAKLPQVSYFEEFSKTNSRTASPEGRKESSFPPPQQISLASGKRSASSPYISSSNTRENQGDDASKHSTASAPISLVAAMRSRFESLSSPQPSAPAVFSSEEVKGSSPNTEKSPKKKKSKGRKHGKQQHDSPSEEKREKREKGENGKNRPFGSSNFVVDAPEGEQPDLLQSQKDSGGDSKSSFTKRSRRGSIRGKTTAQQQTNLSQDALREISLSLDDGAPRALSRHASTLSTQQVNALKRTPSFLSRSHTPPPSALRETVKRSHRRQASGEDMAGSPSLSVDLNGAPRTKSAKSARRASLESSREMKNSEMSSLSGTLVSDSLLGKLEGSKNSSATSSSPVPGTLKKSATAPSAPKRATPAAGDGAAAKPLVTSSSDSTITPTPTTTTTATATKDGGNLSGYTNPILNASLSKSTQSTDNGKSPGASPAAAPAAPAAPNGQGAKVPIRPLFPASPLTKLAAPPANGPHAQKPATATDTPIADVPSPSNATRTPSRSTNNTSMMSTSQKGEASSLMGSITAIATPNSSRKASFETNVPGINIASSGGSARFSPAGFNKPALGGAADASSHKQPPPKTTGYTPKTIPAAPAIAASEQSSTKTTDELSMSFEQDALDSFGAHFTNDRSPNQTPTPTGSKAASAAKPQAVPAKAPAAAAPATKAAAVSPTATPTKTAAATPTAPPVIMHRPGQKKDTAPAPAPASSDAAGKHASPTATAAHKNKDAKAGTPASLQPKPPANNSGRGGGRQVHTYVEEDDIFETVQPTTSEHEPAGGVARPAAAEEEEEEDEEDEDDLLVGFKPEGFDAKSGARKNSNIVFFLTHEDSFSSTEDMVGDAALFASKTDLYVSSSVLDTLTKDKDKDKAARRKIGPKISLDEYRPPAASTSATPRQPSAKPRQGNPYYQGNSSNKSMLSSQRSLTSLTMDAYGLSSGTFATAKNTLPKALKSIYGGTSSRFAPDPKKMHRPVANTFGSRRRRAAGEALDEEDEEDEEDDEEWYWEEVENEEESEEEEEEEEEPPIVRRAPPPARKTST